MVVSNMPGAASARAANYVCSVAPSDGTALGIVAQSIAEEQLLGTPGVPCYATKFNWIGRFAANVESLMFGITSPIKTIEDLKTTEASFAGTGPSSITYPRLLNSIAGMKWKVVSGYNTSSVAHIAMERGEVDGATSSLTALKTTMADWVSKKMIRVIVQYAPTRSPELSDVPAVVEFGKAPEDIEVLKITPIAAWLAGRWWHRPDCRPNGSRCCARHSPTRYGTPSSSPRSKRSTSISSRCWAPNCSPWSRGSTKISNAVLARARAARPN